MKEKIIIKKPIIEQNIRGGGGKTNCRYYRAG